MINRPVLDRGPSKVPEVTLVFWLIKIAATTLGETAGDAVSMSMDLGYLIGTAIFALIFFLAVAVQIKAKKFHPLLYWATIIASTTVGTTLADFADRSLGIGYAGGASLLFALLLSSLSIWYWSLGSISIHSVSSPKAEMFYWTTIMFSRPWVLRLVTGQPITPVLDISAVRLSSVPYWGSWWRPISGRAFRGQSSSGRRSS